MKKLTSILLSIIFSFVISSSTLASEWSISPPFTKSGTQISPATSGNTLESTAIGPNTPSTGAFTTLTATDGSGVLKARAETLKIDVKEKNTSAISKGQVCYISGSSGSKIEVGLGNCTDAAKIRIIGLATADIAQNSDGEVVYKGLIANVDTRTTNTAVNPNAETWAPGDLLWVANTAGGMTKVRPTSGRSIKAARTVKGNSNTDTLIAMTHENTIWATAAAGEDVILRAGDSIGVNKVSIRDYADAEVASVNSDGNLVCTGATLSGLTAGSVPFAGAGGLISQDNANILWDNTNKRLGIGTTSPTSRIHGVTTLSAATGNEIAYQLNYTTNKATSGDDTGLLINMTDTLSPGTSLLADFQVGGASKLLIYNNGNALINGGILLHNGYAGDGFAYVAGQTWNIPLKIGTISGISDGAMFQTVIGIGGHTGTSGNGGLVKINAIYNQTSGTASNTDFLINRTEVAIGSGAQLLIDAQVGGLPKFRVSNVGTTTLYDSYTDASNYEGYSLDAGVTTADTFTIKGNTAGTGADNLNIAITPAGTGTINLSGNVGIGTTAPDGKFNVAQAPGAATMGVYYDTYSATPAASTSFFIRKSASGTLGTKTATVNTDAFGSLAFQGVNSNGNFGYGAVINAVQTGAAGATYIPTSLNIYTFSATGSNDPQLVLASTGNVGISATSFGTSAAKVLGIGSGTAPTTSPADMIQMWSADTGGVAGKAGLHIRTEDGTSHVFGDNVGIGTTTPGAKLEVAEGNIRLYTQGKLLQFYNGTDANSRIGVSYGAGTLLTAAVQGDLIIQNQLNKNIFFATNDDNARMVITGAGNVGIGTTGPGGSLEVVGSGLVISRFNSTATNGGAISYQRSGTPILDIGTGLGLLGVGTNNDVAIYSTSNMYFSAAGTGRMTLLTSGNVGIGTTAPAQKLQIEGGSIGGNVISDQWSNKLAADLLGLTTAPKFLYTWQTTPANTAVETDLSGAVHNATFVGANWAAADQLYKGFGYVLDPDGTVYLNLGDHDDFSFGDGTNDVAFSMGGIIEVVDTASDQIIVAKRDDTTGVEVREYSLNLTSTETMLLTFFDESANVSCYRTTNAALSVGFHTVVVTYDGTGGATAANGIIVYVDGLAVASTATNNASYVAMENLVTPAWIGAYEGTGGTPAGFMTGDIGSLLMDKGYVWSAADAWRNHLYLKSQYNL